MELIDPRWKRIKLEHSYAVICETLHIIWPKNEEEESLISPDDFLKVENGDDVVIKQEDNVVNNHRDDVAIKHEEVPDVDVNQSVDYLNFSVMGQQFENRSHSNSTIVLSDEESDNCNIETKSLDLEDNSALVKKMNECLVIMPKQFFLKLQDEYEKIMRNLRNENERLAQTANILRIDNAERISSEGPGNDSLLNEIKWLQEKLADSKTRENMLEARARKGEEELKLLQERCHVDTKAIEKYIDEINNLKGSLNHKEAQLVHIKQLRSIETVKKGSLELNGLRAECAKLKSVLDTMKKDVKKLQQSLDVEKKKNWCLVKERKLLLEEQQCNCIRRTRNRSPICANDRVLEVEGGIEKAD